MEALSLEACKKQLEQWPAWEVKDGKLHRAFQFKDFFQAFGFMTQVAMHAQSMDHHPEWSNVYNRVEIALITHDAGPGISSKDFELLGRIEASYQNT